MVGRDAEPHEPPGRRQPLDHVDLDRDVGAEQRTGGVEAGRPGADDCDAQRRAHRRAMLRRERELGAAAGAAAADLGGLGAVLDLERVAAAAGGDGVRVVDLEPGLLDRLEVVDARAARGTGR